MLRNKSNFDRFLFILNPSNQLRGLLFALSLILASCSSSDSPNGTLTLPPASIQNTVNNNQSGTVGAALALPFGVIVLDASKNPVKDATVNWAVASGGGTLSAASGTTDSNGISTSTLTLGNSAGSNSVTATVSGTALSTTLTATGIAGAAKTLSFSNYSNSQTQGTPFSVTVTALDALGNTATGYTGTVQFTSTDGSATLPSNYTFSNGDAGTHTFSSGVNLNPNSHTVTVTDAVSTSMTAVTSSITVAGDLTDNSNATVGFAGGSHVGTAWGVASDNTTPVLTLNGTTANYSSLDASWTPEWANLVAYYPMDNNWNDVIGGKNGTPQADPTYDTPNFSNSSKMGAYAGQFNAHNSVVTSLGINVFDTAWSISVWFKSVNTIGYTAVLSFFSDVGGFWFNGENASPSSIALASSQFSSELDSNVPNNTDWNHVILVKTGAASSSPIQMYINGILQANTRSFTSEPGSPTLQYLTIGAISTTGGYSFNGIIDDLAVWNTALTSAEIQTIYSRQSAQYAGTFTSRVINFGSLDSWTSLSWLTTLPFGKELPTVSSTESTTDYPAHISTLQNGLVELWHLDEASGSSNVSDGSGNSNPAGTPTSVTFGGTGKLGTAAAFTSTSSAISFGNGTDLNSMSISAWIQFTSTPSSTSLIAGRLQAANLSNFFFEFNSARKLCFGYNALTNLVCSTKSSWSLDVWYHVTATFDSTDSNRVTLYVNGAPVSATGSVTGTPNTSGSFSLVMGHSAIINLTRFIGYLDEVAIWSRPLSAAEVLEVYRRGANRIKFQIRTCTASDCSDNPTWLGPDGTNQTYFSELQNNSAFTTDGLPTGDVLTSFPTLPFSNFTHFLSSFVTPSRHIQYRAILESDDASTACNGTRCSPELRSVTVAP